MMRVEENEEVGVRNEVKQFQDYRHIGTSEAAHRIFEFRMRDRHPSVKKLPIHLENQQQVYFNEDMPIDEVLARSQVSELTAFFE